LHTVKQQLARNKSTPAVYDALKAKQIFDFIDEDFIPVGQYHEKTRVFNFSIKF